MKANPNEVSKKTMPNEESVEETTKNIESFSARCEDKLTYWKEQLQRIKAENKRSIVWGSGSKCVAFMTTLNVKDEINYIVDINPHRHGKYIPGVGKQIVSPEFLKDYQPEIVIVMNPVYCNEIKQKLESMGLNCELIPCT